jgi:hypothetical protein
MSWASLASNQEVSFTDAAGSGITVKVALPTATTPNKFMTKADALYYLNCKTSLLSALSDVQWVVKSQLEEGTIPITAVGAMTGDLYPGGAVYCGATTPSNATKTYQWQYCSTSNGTFTNISGATSNYYSISTSYIGYYLRCVVTGSGNYSGTVSCTSTTTVSGTIYYSAAIYAWYTKEGCQSGYHGTDVIVDLPYGYYTSYASQEEVDASAQWYAQYYANTNGSCQADFWNTEQHCQGVKNNCQSGYHSPETYSGTVYAHSVSSPYSVDDANDQAQSMCQSDMQDYANQHGSCVQNTTYYSRAFVNEPFQKSDCASGYYGSTHYLSASYGAYTSMVDQDTADTEAYIALQLTANYIGSCTQSGRPTSGLSQFNFYFTVNGVTITSGNVTTYADNFSCTNGCEDWEGETTGAEGADVYLGWNEYTSNKVPDGYYVMSDGGSRWPVYISGGKLHYVYQ